MKISFVREQRMFKIYFITVKFCENGKPCQINGKPKDLLEITVLFIITLFFQQAFDYYASVRNRAKWNFGRLQDRGKIVSQYFSDAPAWPFEEPPKVSKISRIMTNMISAHWSLPIKRQRICLTPSGQRNTQLGLLFLQRLYYIIL